MLYFVTLDSVVSSMLLTSSLIRMMIQLHLKTHILRKKSLNTKIKHLTTSNNTIDNN